MLSLIPGVGNLPHRLDGKVSESVPTENLGAQLVIFDAIGDGICCEYGVKSIALYTTVDDSHVLITPSNGSFGAS
jgi:hypothetical protein